MPHNINFCNTVSAETDFFESSLTPICDHPCAQHAWNFECSLRDCVTGEMAEFGPTGSACFSSMNGVTSDNGAISLGKYLKIVDEEPLGLQVDAGKIEYAKCFSISLWFNPKVIQPGVLISGALAGASGNEPITQGYSGELGATGSIIFNFDGKTFETPTGLVEADNWYHVVFWYNGCTFQIFLNGIPRLLMAPKVVWGLHEGLGEQFTAIGSYRIPIGGNDFRVFIGCIDQVIIWKAPISFEIIQQLANVTHEVKNIQKASVCFDSEVKCASLTSIRWKVDYTAKNLIDPFKCGYISVYICDKESDEILVTLVDQVRNLCDWPGIIEFLGKKGCPMGPPTTPTTPTRINGIIDRCEKTFIIRLNLDLNQLCKCPINLKGKKVVLELQDCAGAFNTKLVLLNGNNDHLIPLPRNSELSIMGVKCLCPRKEECHEKEEEKNESEEDSWSNIASDCESSSSSSSSSSCSSSSSSDHVVKSGKCKCKKCRKNKRKSKHHRYNYYKRR